MKGEFTGDDLEEEPVIDRARIRTLLYLNRGYISDLEAGISGKYAFLWRALYENLRRGTERERDFEGTLRALPTEERFDPLRDALGWLGTEVLWGRRSARGYAELLIFEHDLRERIKKLELYPEKVRELSDKELLDGAIRLKSAERDFLAELVEAFLEVELPDWSERASDYLERVKKWLEELLKIAPLWRVHLAHLWYARYQVRGTPSPYAMLSVYVYTAKPDDWPDDLFEDALKDLELDPEKFGGSFGATDHSTGYLMAVSAAARRKGYGPPSAFYRIQGVERAMIDRDELGEYEEDEMRYYCCFYERGRPSGEYNISKEYWGWLEMVPPPKKWIIHPQDGSATAEEWKEPPKWKKSMEDWEKYLGDEFWEGAW